MTELNHPQIPTAALQALHFIVRLDPEIFKEFTASALNAHRSGGAFPDTIQKASEAAKAYIPLVRVSNQCASNLIVFSPNAGTRSRLEIVQAVVMPNQRRRLMLLLAVNRT
jgi:hypothetical protein